MRVQSRSLHSRIEPEDPRRIRVSGPDGCCELSVFRDSSRSLPQSISSCSRLHLILAKDNRISTSGTVAGCDVRNACTEEQTDVCLGANRSSLGPSGFRIYASLSTRASVSASAGERDCCGSGIPFLHIDLAQGG